MIEIIKVKQQTDPATGRTTTSPVHRKNKFMEGAVPHGNNVRVDTRQERGAEDRRVPEEEEDEILPDQDEEELFTRESIKTESTRLAAEEKRLLERQVGF